MVFKDIENPENKNKKISIIEKSLILTLIGIVKIILWKIKRAKTYGDLMLIGNFIENKIDTFDDKYPDNMDVEEDEAINIINNEVKIAENELKNL